MLSKAKQILVGVGGLLVGVLLLLFNRERSKNKELSSEVTTLTHDKNEAGLVEREANIEKQVEDEKKKEPPQPLTGEELANYLKKL